MKINFRMLVETPMSYYLFFRSNFSLHKRDDLFWAISSLLKLILNSTNLSPQGSFAQAEVVCSIVCILIRFLRLSLFSTLQIYSEYAKCRLTLFSIFRHFSWHVNFILLLLFFLHMEQAPRDLHVCWNFLNAVHYNCVLLWFFCLYIYIYYFFIILNLNVIVLLQFFIFIHHVKHSELPTSWNMLNT